MKVKLEEGPNTFGLKTGVELDTDELSPEEADELRNLCEALERHPTPQTQAAPKTGTARDVTITINSSEHKFTEDQPPPQAEPLLDFLRQRATVIPNK